jgi:hypothetical protein
MFLPFRLIEGSQYLIKVEVHIFISKNLVVTNNSQFQTLFYSAQIIRF